MTEITFIGTGEAFDPKRANTSYLIEEGSYSLLVDCGYTVPQSLMKFLGKKGSSLADFPNGVLFTHEHGDHIAGFPALIVPMFEEVNEIVGKRVDGLKRNLEVISASQGVLDKLKKSFDEDYKGVPSIVEKKGPNLEYKTINDDDEFNRFKINFAQSSHSVPNFAYKFTNSENGKSFAISGDGALSEETKKLYPFIDLLIHEGFQIRGNAGTNHSSVEQIIEYAGRYCIPKVAIVHVNREQREKTKDIKLMIKYAKEKDIKLWFPNDHEKIIL